MKTLRLLIILTLMVSAAWRLPAQHTPSQETTRVLIILDCSQSMWDKWQSDSKIKVTQQVLLRFLDSIQGHTDMEVALRVFGHLNKDAISTQLEVPFASDNAYQLKSKLKTLVPNGGCTAATALDRSLKDFPKDDHARNIILIITDGMDDPDGNLCDVAERIQQSGTVVQTFIIGIGSPDNFKQQPDCAGHFTMLCDEERLDETLHEIFFLSDQDALLTLSLVDQDNRPYQTDVPVTFNDHQTHTLRYTVLYHYNTEDPIDTLEIDPLLTYDITIHTIPPIHYTDRHFKPGSHTLLQVPAPQSTLTLHLENRRIPFQLPIYTVLVRRHDDPALLATQPIGASRNYLAGQYDIEILTLPVTRLTNVKLRGGTASDLQIPMPGQLALSKPGIPTTGSIFVFQGNSLQWVCDLDPSNPTERVILMPGDYQVILRPVNDPDPDEVRTARFTILPAKSTSLTIK